MSDSDVKQELDFSNFCFICLFFYGDFGEIEKAV